MAENFRESQNSKNEQISEIANKEVSFLGFEIIKGTCLYFRTVKNKAGVEYYQIIEKNALQVANSFKIFNLNWENIFGDLLFEDEKIVAQIPYLTSEEPRTSLMENINILLLSKNLETQGSQYMQAYISLYQNSSGLEIGIYPGSSYKHPNIISLAIYMKITGKDFPTYRYSTDYSTVKHETILCTDRGTGNIYMFEKSETSGPRPTEACWECSRCRLEDLLVKGCLDWRHAHKAERISKKERPQHFSAFQRIFGDRFELIDKTDALNNRIVGEKIDDIYIVYR